jgi:hypothetical protein
MLFRGACGQASVCPHLAQSCRLVRCSKVVSNLMNTGHYGSRRDGDDDGGHPPRGADTSAPEGRFAGCSAGVSKGGATIAVSMAIDRPRAIGDAPAGPERSGGWRRKTFLPREEWAKPRGRKSRRGRCGKTIEAQPILRPDQAIKRPPGHVPDDLQGEDMVDKVSVVTECEGGTSIPRPRYLMAVISALVTAPPFTQRVASNGLNCGAFPP